MTSVFQWGSLSYSSAPFSLFHAPYEFLHLTHPFASSIRRPLALHRVACSQRESWDCGPAEGPMYVGRRVKQWSHSVMETVYTKYGFLHLTLGREGIKGDNSHGAVPQCAGFCWFSLLNVVQYLLLVLRVVL